MEVKKTTTRTKVVEDVKINPDHVDGNALLVNKVGAVRQLPPPSGDPNDPLNFPKWMKLVLSRQAVGL
jgi:hypothetical protein